MALPQQTFNTLQDLVNYTNTTIIPNSRKEINGTENNNVLNGLAEFIPAYTVNGDNDGAEIVSGGGAVVLQKPVSIITGIVPTSVTFNDNVQKEHYIVNTFGVALTLTSVTYFDNFLVEQTTIPGRASLHIAQATNGEWIQIATPLPGSGGSGGGGNGQGNLF